MPLSLIPFRSPKKLSAKETIMKDIYRSFMTITPEYEFCDVPIEDLSLHALAPFADADGNFTKSFDVTLKGIREFEEIWILSSTAKYESKNGDIPVVQTRLINSKGKTMYYSPVYEIGHPREFYRREWRIPPTRENFDTVRISFIIPDGVALHIRDVRSKRNTRYRGENIGIRYHGHAGFPGYAASNSVFGFQMAAEMGFTSCITIPKFTKDGIGVCFHDDSSVRQILRYDDGSIIEKGSHDDKPVWQFTYDELLTFDAGIRKGAIHAKTRVPTLDDFFRICSMTGMQPIFSVHPALTKEQWEYVRELLVKYRLLDKFWIKTGVVSAQRTALEVFDDDIAGYIILQGTKESWDPAERAAECGFDRSRHNVVTEYFYISSTEDSIDEKIKLARSEGFNVSVAAMLGGTSGVAMRKLIDLGVSEFTLDYHCSMGLDW